MLVNEIISWDAKARQNFTYQADPPGEDTWRSHAADVLSGKPWSDDCDGLAETVLDLCIRAGLPITCAFRLVVRASSDGSGHMVGCIFDVVGSIWIVGDTFVPFPYPAAQMRHTPDIYNRLSEQAWRAGAPWKLIAPTQPGEPHGRS